MTLSTNTVNEETKRRGARHRTFTMLVCVLTVVVALFYSFSYLWASDVHDEYKFTNVGTLSNNNAIDISDDWTLTYEDGTTETVSFPAVIKTAPNESITLTRKWVDTKTMNPTLYFTYPRCGLEVRADNKLMFSVNKSSFAKKLFVQEDAIVPMASETILPDYISIKLSNAKDGVYDLHKVSYNSLYALKFQIMREEILTEILLVLIALVGVQIILMYAVYSIKKYKEDRLVCISGFLLLVWFWALADSNIPALMGIPHEITAAVMYTSLMGMPIPMVLYGWMTINKKGYVLPVYALVGIINILVQLALTTFGVFRINQTVMISHIYALIGIVCMITEAVRAAREEMNVSIRYFLYGGCILYLSAIGSMGVYWISGRDFYRIGILIGSLVFLICLALGLALDYTSRSRAEQFAQQEADISEQLSFYDTLTGLQNRRAFERKLEEISGIKEYPTNAILAKFDVNGLKNTNITYGNAAGDELIIKAANLIESVYALTDGECFRIGGDEFAVIIEEPSCSVSELERQLEESIHAANIGTQWKLSIASGYAHLYEPNGARRSISDWKLEADVQMYRHKVATVRKEMRDANEEVRMIIDSVVGLVEAKDVYTAEHSDRVRQLSIFIAKKLGLSANTIENVEKAAYLHDIGKIGVPDYILNKPGRLTDEEFDAIKKHSSIGAQLVGNVASFEGMAEVVAAHHERYDGRGYPQGLVGVDIPIEARIIAIADSIDAMTSKRVYRDSLPMEVCRQEIEKNAGLMYDPAMTKIVLENWDGIVSIVKPKK